MSVPISLTLAEMVKTLGAEYSLDVDEQTVVLRATGPYRWDVHGIGEYEGRVYGTVTAVDEGGFVMWRYPLRKQSAVFSRHTLVVAVRDLVEDWPHNVDPIDLATQTEGLLDTLELVLNDPAARWSADYETLLERLAAATSKLGVAHDHVHNIAIVLAADHDSHAWGTVAEQSADTADACGKLAALTLETSKAAGEALRGHTSRVFARGLLSAYWAARRVEACAGRTGAEA